MIREQFCSFKNKTKKPDLFSIGAQTRLSLLSRPEPTKFLIKNNASLSAVDKVNRNTPLHCAVLAGNVDAAHILLEAGANVDAENLSVSLRGADTCSRRR